LASAKYFLPIRIRIINIQFHLEVIADETDKKEKVSPLQALICAGLKKY